MVKKHFISVVLPLRLEWEPVYYTTDCQEIGDRVRVVFAGKEYVGVVSGTDIEPGIEDKKIKAVVALEHGMVKIRREEIELWRQISRYYLCTVGEVYKAAYPVGKINMEEARAAARQKSVGRKEKMLTAIELRIKRLQERLQKKTEAAERSKEGTKTKAACIEDIAKINAGMSAGSITW